MGDSRDMAAAFEAALKSGDFGRMTAAGPGVRDGRLRQGVAAVRGAPDQGRRDPDGRAVSRDVRHDPKFTYKRMLGGGDMFVVEGTIDYGDGVPVSYVGDRRAPRRQGREDDRVLREPVRGAGLARRLRRADGAGGALADEAGIRPRHATYHQAGAARNAAGLLPEVGTGGKGRWPTRACTSAWVASSRSRRS